jgi:hypothetical protein
LVRHVKGRTEAGIFETRVFVKIYESKREKVTEYRRSLHIEDFNDLYSQPHVIRVIGSRIVTYARRVACMEGVEKWVQGSFTEK